MNKISCPYNGCNGFIEPDEDYATTGNMHCNVCKESFLDLNHGKKEGCETCTNRGWSNYCTAPECHALSEYKRNPLIVKKLQEKIMKLELDIETTKTVDEVIWDSIWEELGKPDPFMIGEIPGHIKELKQKIASLEKALSDSSGAIKMLGRENQKLFDQLEESRRYAVELRSKVEELSKDIKDSHKTVDDLTKRVEDLSEKKR